MTPGVINTGSRLWTSNRQNTYPGNKGDSTTLSRSDHLRLVVNVGSSVSSPLARSSSAVAPSHRVRICSANQLTLPFDLSWFMACQFPSPSPIPRCDSYASYRHKFPPQHSKRHRSNRNQASKGDAYLGNGS